jgi:hypothetical protein
LRAARRANKQIEIKWLLLPWGRCPFSKCNNNGFINAYFFIIICVWIFESDDLTSSKYFVKMNLIGGFLLWCLFNGLR